MARKHKMEEVLQQLRKKNDCKVNNFSIEILSDYIFTKNGKMPNPKKKNDLGNGSWGKIDFLVNYCNFTRYFVSDFSR